MAKIDIIREAENHLDPSILNGTLMLKGQPTPLKDYLEGVFLDALKEGSTYESVLKFIDTYLMKKITPAKTTTMETISYPEENVSYIDSFLNSHHVFASSVQLTKSDFQTVRSKLLELSTTMDENHLFHVGGHIKTIQDICEDILNNAYNEPTIVDKTELSMFYVAQMKESENEVVQNALSADMGREEPISMEEYLETVFPLELDSDLRTVVLGRKLQVSDAIELLMKQQVCRINIQGIEEDVLESYIDFGNGKKQKTSAYILENLPNFMISLFKVKFNADDNEYDIGETIQKIVKNQRVSVELERTKAQTTIIKANNRFTESADLFTIGIETVDGEVVAKPVAGVSKLDGITVASANVSLLTPEEQEAAHNIEDYSRLTDDDYFFINLDCMADAIRSSRTIEDLTAASRSLEQLIKSSYQLTISENTKKYMSYATSLVERKRQELMKVDSNLEDYTQAIRNALEEINNTIEGITDSEEHARLYAEVTRIEIELMRKCITDDEITSLLDKVKTKLKINSVKTMILHSDVELEVAPRMAA